MAYGVENNNANSQQPYRYVSAYRNVTIGTLTYHLRQRQRNGNGVTRRA